MFKFFKSQWSTKKDFFDLLTWWDIGKIKIKQLCQQYGKERACRFRQEKNSFEGRNN